MERIENGTDMTIGSSTQTHKNFPIYCDLWGKECLKRILTYLFIEDN